MIEDVPMHIYNRMGHNQENCYSLHGFLYKIAKVSKYEVV